MTNPFAMKIVKSLLVVAFAGALVGLFVIENYLMIEGHRPNHEVLSEGFAYPILGKGGIVYVSLRDLVALLILIAIATVSAIGANLASRNIS